MTTRRPRRQRRPDERPNELLEAALAVFSERGYHDASLDDVAAAAGVTKGAIYHYFDTKAELLIHAIEQHQARGHEELEASLPDPTAPANVRVRALLRKAFAGNDDVTNRAILVMLQAAAREVPEIHSKWLGHGPLKAWQLLARIIEDGKESGEFRRDVDADIAARVVLSGVLLQVLWQKYAPGVPGLAVDRDRLIDSAADLLLAGLRADPSAKLHTRK